MTRTLVGGLVGAVLAVVLTPALSASQITIEWNGIFDIPDIVDPPGVFVEIIVAPDPGGMDLITDSTSA